jgi:serine/threonine protein kinase
MGEVYRARDTRLDRTVAIKVLPSEVSSDPERKRRLEREARAISAFSHPNICQLYDVGSHNGLDYLVMEYLEGETLAQRLRRGPLPVGLALKVGGEIADALDKAHQHGIVHRDLKPGNIMLTKTGAKLLDFGLAKPAAVSVGMSHSATTLTEPSAITGEGVIVGTLPYMAPEQLEGKEADTRSDIFALGTVLYEAATGKAAFAGKSPASIIAAVLKSDPQAVIFLQPTAPALLDHVIRTALAKNPENRWQSAYDVKLQLNWIESHMADADTPSRHSVAGFRRWALWAVTLALLAICALLAVGYSRRASVAPQQIRSSILPPPKDSFVAHNFAISPDGRRLAFVAVGSDGRNNLWVRSLKSSTAQQLAGTEGAIYPFWSPDSNAIGFFAEGKLKTVTLGDGTLRVVCDAPIGRGGAWNRDGTIVFAPFVFGPLRRVSSSGGTPVTVTRIAREGSGQSHRWPVFLPDGRHFLFFVDWSSPEDPQGDGIYVSSLDSPDTKLVSADITGSIQYASGRLLFVQNRSLMAQLFDLERLQLTGSATALAEEELVKDPGFSQSDFSASADGTIVFHSARDAVSELLWFDRTGKEIGSVPGSAFKDPRLSPDGRLLAVAFDAAKNGKYSIYVLDIARGLRTRLTDGGDEQYPVWSPDGKRITFVSGTGKEYRLSEVAADGSGVSQVLVRGAKMIPNGWSPDGKHLIYMDFEKGLPYLSIYSAEDGSHRQFWQGAEGQFSPDGKWIAYLASGSLLEVVAQRFPAGPRIQISSGGGAQASWSRDGREVFYMAPDRKLVAVKFDPEGKYASSPPVPLFQTRVIAPNFVVRQYDVSTDAKHFIVNSLPPAGSVPLTLLSNSIAEPEK